MSWARRTGWRWAPDLRQALWLLVPRLGLRQGKLCRVTLFRLGLAGIEILWGPE